jgi:hypothetical protein
MVRGGWEAYRRWRKRACSPDLGQLGIGLAATLWAPSGMSSEAVAPVIVIVVLLPPCHPLSMYCVLAGFSITNCFRMCTGGLLGNKLFWGVCIESLENHSCLTSDT